MSRTKAAEVRFYIDADLLGLARVLAGLRADVTYPGDPGAVIHKRHRPPCPITSPAIKDSDWIPEVARRGWLIITRDRHIQEHRLEIQAVREHGARMIALTGEDAGSVFAQGFESLRARLIISGLTCGNAFGPFSLSGLCGRLVAGGWPMGVITALMMRVAAAA